MKLDEFLAHPTFSIHKTDVESLFYLLKCDILNSVIFSKLLQKLEFFPWNYLFLPSFQQ